ncbi:YaaC-like Protein [Chitinophaga terrae (ex Kim and Jung 2007)]|uniref:YaaC-like Protein n=1 Tax=Chitinophaga terrae (ex Kim and Jung 2007) TaxID=408074 RepID=A0A1H4GS08_9BACT|nr:YaaC family protein [Chitinophaga terrae (ex Kim and Jung 2007)]GEP93711.1 hypothetical protein CTE07_53560 [Chitinophaga terrae (ex Kim and Jung 2007)]SEB12314.1 YaaC-like Protein [Chitinophaga terrae (ex Kim and Jung 2007)]
MQNKAWNKLLEFETRDLVERFIKNKHNRDSTARQVLEITSNFIQAREYFKNSQRAEITVKPLLQYYGVASLARGLILSCSPKISESSMKPSHGLDTLNWREALVKKDFGSLTVTIKQGTFYELLTSTGNKTYLKHNSSGVNWSLDFPLPKIGTQITLIDLVQTISDFSDEFETWTQRKLHFLTIQSLKHSSQGEGYEFVVNKPIDSSTIAEILSEEIYGPYSITENGGKTTISTKTNHIPQFSQRFTDPFNIGIGDISLTRPINNNLYLNVLSQYYLLSFFLGMLSRYFPSTWISLGRTEKGDSVYPLFIKIIDAIDKYFPLLIVEYLGGPYNFEKKEIA